MADDSALTFELAERLIRAVPEYPTFETTCASQGVNSRTVENWIRRGQQPGAAGLLEDFARVYLQAEARHAAELYAQYLDALRCRQAGVAKCLFELMDKRWKIATSCEVLTTARAGSKRTDDLRAMLLHPSPRLRAALRETGWERSETWQSPVRQLTAGRDDGESAKEH